MFKLYNTKENKWLNGLIHNDRVLSLSKKMKRKVDRPSWTDNKNNATIFHCRKDAGIMANKYVLLVVGLNDVVIEIHSAEFDNSDLITHPNYLVIPLSKVEDKEYIAIELQEYSEIDWNDWKEIVCYDVEYEVVA